MIIIHEGVPGSGKSYDAIRKIIDALRAGRVVYTNIDGLDRDDCREYLAGMLGITRDALALKLFHLTADEVRRFWEICPDGAFIVIDEAQLFFNSRDFAKVENRVFSDWASTHRHHGFDLLLITQRAARIDTAVRSLSEFRYRYRKLNVFGSLFSNGYLVYTFAGEDDKHMRIEKRTYDVKIFPCYNSYQGDATEKRVQKNPNLLNHPIFYALGFCLALCLYFIPQSQLFSGHLADIATGGKKHPVKSSPVDKGTGAAPAIAATAPASPSPERNIMPESGFSRLVTVPFQGYFQDGSKAAVLVDGIIYRSFVRVDLVHNRVTLLRSDYIAPVSSSSYSTTGVSVGRESKTDG